MEMVFWWKKRFMYQKVERGRVKFAVPNTFGNFDTASNIMSHEAKPRVISEVSRQYLDGRQARSPDRSQS